LNDADKEPKAKFDDFVSKANFIDDSGQKAYFLDGKLKFDTKYTMFLPCITCLFFLFSKASCYTTLNYSAL
jgi:hypothetical protein